MLNRIINQKQKQIDGLQETLSIPRNHFKNIERLTAEEIIKQKDIILEQMSKDMAIPKEQLVEKMYEKSAKKEAKK
jgi:hypothetical protein